MTTAAETQLQERVIAHLAVADWERVEVDEDLDLIGPVASRTLLRTGPLWPPHAYTMVPLLEAAHDGVFLLVTGLSDFFAFWRWAPLVSVLAAQRRPTGNDARLLAMMSTPTAIRARVACRRGMPPPMPWLRPAAERRARASLARRGASIPFRFDRAIMTQTTHRCFDSATAVFRALGELVEANTDLPLGRPEVVAAFAGAGGWQGFGDITVMLHRICGDLLPADMLVARPAADRSHVFFGERARAFAARWDGAGIDESLVDPGVLRRTWLSDCPDPRTACLLQSAWLMEQDSLAGGVPAPGEPALCPTTQTGAT